MLPSGAGTGETPPVCRRIPNPGGRELGWNGMTRPEITVFTRFLAALAALGLAAAPAVAADITAIRVAPESSGTRIIIESDVALQARMFTLAEQGLRLVVDTQRVDFEIPGDPAPGGQRRAPGAGLVSQIRFAQNAADASRVVFDLSGPAAVSGQSMVPPASDYPYWRLVLDLAPASFDAFAAAAGAAPVALASAASVPEMGGPEYVIADTGSGPLPRAVITEPAAAPPPVSRPVVVIDAGHGGKDSGTVGTGGNYEKTVVLAAALQLRDILQATGRYDVRLTRATDIFLELDERVRFARNSGADLYIALHADASPNRNTRGATVYTVNERGQSRTRQRVQNNTWQIVDAPQTAEVGNILLDLSMTDTKNQSSAFAEMLRADVSAVSSMVQNPHREDNFYVLLAPDVPAVLLEMGFMSNPQDESNLISASYRQTLMQAVAGSIDDYFGQRLQQVAGN